MVRLLSTLLFFTVLLFGAGIQEVLAFSTPSPQQSCSGANHVVRDYASLRAAAGGNGQTAELTGSKIAGCFEWSPSDPNGNGDDGGIVIASRSGGFWVRKWSYGPQNPIELDWFGLANGDNITQLVNRLAAAYRPNFYIRMPTTSMTLLADGFWNFSCSGHAIQRLRFLESSAKVTIKYSGRGNSYRLMDVGSQPGTCSQNIYDLVIGTDQAKGRDSYNLWFDGTVDGPCKGCESGQGILQIRADRGTDYVAHFRLNIKNARGRGLTIVGPSYHGPKTAYISGRFESASIAASGGAQNVVLDDVYYSDPYARNWGWTGAKAGGEAVTDYDTYGSHQVGVTFTFVRGLYGKIEQEFGGQLWGIHFVEYLGKQGEPLTYTRKNAGFLGDGTPIKEPWIATQWGKVDPASIRGSEMVPGRRFMKFVDKGSDFGKPVARLKLQLEATDERCDGDLWHNSYMDITLVNVHDQFRSGTLSYCNGRPEGVSAYHVFRGNGSEPAMVSPGQLLLYQEMTVTQGQWHTIHINRHLYEQGSNGSVYKPCNDNSLKDVSLTGTVKVDGGCPGTTLSNVTWLGNARTVMTVGANADVTASNLRAPAGSRVEGSGTFILDGRRVSLPYTFDGSGGGGVISNRAPSATELSVSTAENTPVAVTLRGSDPDGDELTYRVATQPSNGKLSGNAPHLTYTPNASFIGSDSFTFTVSDGTAQSGSARVSITVKAGTPPSGKAVVQELSLKSGWNTVSLHVTPKNARLDSVLNLSAGEVVLVKNERGDVFYPALEINDIGVWRIDEAYQVHVTSNATASVVGSPIAAEATPIALDAGWNLVPYLLDVEKPIEEAFASILKAVVLVETEDGSVYDPRNGTNTIGTLTPGEGYRVYLSQPATLAYGDDSGPFAHWTFEGSGPDLPDMSANNHDGTIHGATPTDGIFGGALSFDGVDDYVDLGTMDIPGSEMTIAAWINADSFNDPHGRIITKAHDAYTQDHWWMLSTFVTNDGFNRLRFRLKTNGSTTTLIGNSGHIKLGEWAHAVARYDGQKMELYLNGQLVGSAPASGPIDTDSSIPVWIGRNPSSDERGYYFDGRIDDLRIYDRALSAEEIQTLATPPSGA